ncbi:MAG: LuxR C-terminal-related transcriptional regulator [Actinomycetota bacterium]|nr:LuxR C-terminal-related transcriptional regulator [Actinomycetota bacterium]
MTGAPAPPLRLAGLVATLSVATDLGKGLPLEQAQRACLAAMRLAALAGLSEQDRRTTYYASLLRFVGCTASAHEFATVFGDDIAGSSWFAAADPADMREVLGIILRNAGKGEPGLRRVRAVARVLSAGPKVRKEHEQASCEVARLLADRLSLGPEVQDALGQVFERWDGKGGVPGERRGEAIALPVRVGHVAHYGELFHRLDGVDGAVAALRARSGRMFDPALVELACSNRAELFDALPGPATFDAVVAAEPEPWTRLDGEGVDRALRAMGDFADLKSPFTVGHSDGVARLAAAAGATCGLDADAVVDLRRAGWIHDLGRCAVSTGIWDKPGPLSDGEWERVRLHGYHTGRIVSRCPPLAAVGATAVLHHERVDGSGYHRGLGGRDLPLPAALLAAADVYHALLEARPHRPAFAAHEAAAIVARERAEGRLHPDAAGAVLEAAGWERPPRAPADLPGGLSGREVEVLALLARGRTNAQVAAELFISPKTVGAHVEHIYRKIGVSTRAAATVFALGHDLVRIG